MFEKKKKPVEKENPIQEPVVPQEIEELAEPVIDAPKEEPKAAPVEEPVAAPVEDQVTEPVEEPEVNQGLTEERVIEILSDHEKRIGNLEHHARIDFN